MDAEAIGPEGELSAYRIVSRTTHDMPVGDVLSYVYSKWLRSLRYENDFFRLMDAKAYWLSYKRHIFNVLSLPATILRTASLADDPDVLLGFAVHRGPILDYVYVHRHQRRLGIASRLVPADIDTITHLTKAGLSIWGSKHGNWKFNPFA